MSENEHIIKQLCELKQFAFNISSELALEQAIDLIEKLEKENAELRKSLAVEIKTDSNCAYCIGTTKKLRDERMEVIVLQRNNVELKQLLSKSKDLFGFGVASQYEFDGENSKRVQKLAKEIIKDIDKCIGSE